VPDPALGHHRDAHGGAHLFDHLREGSAIKINLNIIKFNISEILNFFSKRGTRLRVTHPSNAAVGTDQRRNPLQGHHLCGLFL
jgi:hypothetical protein